MHYLFSVFLAFLVASPLTSSAQTQMEDEGLRDLIDEGNGFNSLTNGNGIYVKNQAKRIPDDVLYDQPNGLQSTLVRADGRQYSVKARYHRESGQIEMWYGGRSYAADGDVFPYALIGDNVYAFNDLGGVANPSLRYGKLVAGSSETDYQIIRRYQITKKSNQPSSNAFSREAPASYRVDSTDYIIGDRPFALEVHRRQRRFRTYLTACGATAHDTAESRAKYLSSEYYAELIAALQRQCPIHVEDEATNQVDTGGR